MKKISILLIFCLGILPFVSVTGQVLNDSGQHGEMFIQTKKGPAMAALEGTPYENEEFIPGRITLEGKKPVDALLRYDVVNEEIEIKTEKNSPEIYILPNKKAEYLIGTNRFLHKSYRHNGNLVEGYFKEYFNGENVSLLKKLSATKTEPFKAQTGYQKDRPGQIRIQEKFFLVLEDGSIEEVKLKEKSFQSALPKSKEINKYFSDNKVKSLEDFIKMLEWYDQQA